MIQGYTAEDMVKWNTCTRVQVHAWTCFNLFPQNSVYNSVPFNASFNLLLEYIFPESKCGNFVLE